MKKNPLLSRSDGTLIKEIDSMHFIMPLMYPDRCDNEAFISERIDFSKMDAYLEKKNAESAFCEAIEKCGELLAPYFPADKDDNPDELDNGVVILER